MCITRDTVNVSPVIQFNGTLQAVNFDTYCIKIIGVKQPYIDTICIKLDTRVYHQ